MSHKRLPNSPLENGCVESKLFQDHESILRTDEVWYDLHYGKYALSYACRREFHLGCVANPLGVPEIVIRFFVFLKVWPPQLLTFITQKVVQKWQFSLALCTKDVLQPQIPSPPSQPANGIIDEIQNFKPLC